MSNAAFTSPLGPNPWLDWPCPISLEKPKLQITLTNFHCHYLPRELHPYRLDTEPGAEATIYFHEMRGFGPPPGDVGYPGDVYIDMSPGAHGLWAIRTPNGGEWTHWTPNEIIQHPHITYYYLWCSTRGEVSWYPRIVHHALSQDENHGSRDAGALIAEMLRANARRPIRRDGESAEPAPRKRLNLGKTSDTGGGNVPLSLTNGCQLLSDANEKLSQEISAHPGTRMESSGKQPSKCSDGSESINSDPMATSRLTSKVVIPSASVGCTRLDKSKLKPSCF